ncbi:MAG: hypothetical protein R3200_02335 [Xanthomonadales bacterium]|nr:hypothetical protein [Xanthomonadales bacterium]
MVIRLLPLLFLISFQSADAATIRLYDGTVVRGQIVRFADGVYTIESESLGELELKESKIEGIDFNESATPRATRPNETISQDQVEDLQRSMVLNPSIFARIQDLRDDPAIQEALEDPAIADAISSGNYAALLNNPKFLALLRHPDIQAISRQVLSGN